MASRMRHVEMVERIVVCAFAVLCAAVLAFVALAGPLCFNLIHYRAPSSTVYQAKGQDLINLVLIAPICLVGGALAAVGSAKSPRFLMFPAIYLMYAGLAYGVGMEWSDPRYTGNSERFAFLFIFLLVCGLVFLFYSFGHLTGTVMSRRARTGKIVYSAVFVLFVLAFAVMWCTPIVEIMRTGTTRGYDIMPTGFWTIRVLDLGITIPLGLLSVYVLWTRPDTGYPVQLLFYGFFITQITAVLAMAAFQFAARDSSVVPGSLVVFGGLALIVYGGFFYVFKPRRLYESR